MKTAMNENHQRKSMFINFLKLTFVIFTINCTLPSPAQISEGGTPPGLTFSHLRSSGQTYEAAVDFDVNALLAEDEELEALGIPPRCARIIPANLTTENSGQWFTLPDGQHIWTLEIHAPDALAIMLYYNQFILPEGGRLFLYDADHSKILGAYTHRTNSKKAEFATEFVPGDRIILEYVAPDKTILPQINISGIAYGYNHLNFSTGNNLSLRSRWNSESCMINVNCPEGAEWQDQKKGVARMVTPTGGGYVSLCSGTLINNTLRDFDPLFLSAHHCFEDMSASTLDQTIYYFNYEYSGCNNLGTDPNCPTMVGAQLLVDLPIAGSSDGALLRLNDPVPTHYDVYFNGWDRRNTPPTSGVNIHHPAGDVKKISTYESSGASVTWNGSGATGASNAHWNVHFSATESGHSVTEGGSSGSPLFNQNKLVVGSLTGGNSSCSYKNGDNLYGKLWYHWDRGAQKMSTYLDPNNSGLETLEGVYLNYNLVNASFSVPQEDLYASRPIEFTNVSRNDTLCEWSFEGGNPQASTERNPFVIFNNPGIYRVSLTVNKGMATETTVSKEIEIIVKEKICPEETTIGDENPSQIQAYPLGANRRQIFSSALYTAEEISSGKKGKITQISWNAGAASTTPRTLYVYLEETSDNELTRSSWTNTIQNATLVYESTDDWTNPAGWVTINLQKTFKYSGTKNLKVTVRSFSQTNNGINTSCFYSPATDKHLYWYANSSNIPTSNGTVDSNRPDIRFNLDLFCGAEAPVADFLTGTFTINEPAEYLIMDEILFTDLSTGPAVNWEWSFPGGTPESSREENPSVIYDKPGIYRVKLKISNHLGEDSTERTLLIKPKTPLVAFSSSSNGFTTYPDYGQFLPYSGGSVSFIDKSLYNPTGWKWDLEGIGSFYEEDNTITINYPAGANTYSVNLTASNGAGADTKEINDYIQVGGTAQVWNIPYGDEGETYHLLSEGNYLTGTNTTYSILAEKFTCPGTGSISQIDILMKVFNNSGITSQTYSFTVYNEEENKPGTVLGEASLRNTMINPSGYTTVSFPAPVNVPGNFYIEIKGLVTLNTKVAIASSEQSDPTVYVYKNQAWSPLEDIDPEGRKVSLNIVPTFTYTEETSVNSLETGRKQVELYPNPIRNDLNIRSESPIEKIVVVDVQGRTIQTVKHWTDGQILPVSHWGKGIYIVKIQTPKDSYNYKVIKE
jgi:PKD repeat protein